MASTKYQRIVATAYDKPEEVDSGVNPPDLGGRHSWPKGEVARCRDCETIRWQKPTTTVSRKFLCITLYQVRGSEEWVSAAPPCTKILVDGKPIRTPRKPKTKTAVLKVEGIVDNLPAYNMSMATGSALQVMESITKEILESSRGRRW